MSERYQGTQLSKDVRPAQDLTPARPIPPSFRDRNEFEGFQLAIKNAFDQGLLPSSIKTLQAAIVVACKGRELGLDPLYALSVIYVIGGKPALEGEAMLGLVLRKYPNAHVRWVESTHQKAVLELGRPGGPTSTFTFSVEDAKRAGMISKINEDGTVVASQGKQVWQQYTRKMLCWRAISEGVTLLFPECIQGCLTPDELKPAEPQTNNYTTANDIEAEVAEALPPAPIHTSRPEAFEAMPDLPDLSQETKPKAAAAPVHTPQPKAIEPEVVQDRKPVKTNGDYTFPSGQFFGRTIGSLPEAQLRGYLAQLKLRSARQPDPEIEEMMIKVRDFLG